MKLQNLKYFLQESTKSMFRNRLMSMASIVTVMGCTLILAISYFIITNVNQIMSGVERSMSVVAFLEIGISEEEIAILEAELLDLYYVSNLSFRSSEEAFLNLAEDMGIEEALLYGLTEDIFPASFSIEVNYIDNQVAVVEEISAFAGIDTIRHDQEAMDMFINFSRAITIFGFITIAFLGGISTVIIINTIKITVSARQTEINIMKYVGATDSFIRWPFMMEGMLMGILGALLALVISYFIYTNLLNNITTGESPIQVVLAVLGFVPIEVNEIFMILAPVSIATGITIGVIGSATSMRKYLRV